MKRKAKLANEAWEALLRARATIAQELIEGDVWGDLAPGDYAVLYALSTVPAGIRMSELVKDVLLSQAGLSRLIARLESRGLVARAIDPADGRASLIRLSKAGVHVQRRVGAAHGRHVADVMSSRLGDDELVALRDLCRRLVPLSAQAGKDRQ